MTELVNTYTGRSNNKAPQRKKLVLTQTTTSQPVVKTDTFPILWDFAIPIDRKIDANKPDIPIKDHKNKSCILTELMFLKGKNLPVVEFGKITKSEDLEIEIKRMQHLKLKLVPVVVRAFGTVKKTQNNI